MPATIESSVEAKLLVNGERPASIVLRAKIRRIKERIGLASVVQYFDPLTATSHAELGRHELGESESIENSDNVAMTIDLSTITIPDNRCLETVTVDAGRVVNMRPQIIGATQAMSARIPIQLRYEFSKA